MIGWRIGLCGWLVAMVLALSVGRAAIADEYFLSGDQKQQLLLYGRMTGDDGAEYDIWIVPGYAPPLRHVKRGWVAAGHDLSEYGSGGLYRDLFKSSRKGMRFAGHDVVGEFALEGTAKAWGRALTTAQGRVQRRVFGWWFAYPWAVLEGSVQTVVRLGLGLPSGAVVGVGSVSLVPVYYVGKPVVKAAGHALIEGTVYPVAASGWNTVVAPPLAVLGQRPAEERADGFWMKRLNDPVEDQLLAIIDRWRQDLLTTVPTTEMDVQVQAMQVARNERVASLQREIAQANQHLAQSKQQLHEQWLSRVLQAAAQSAPQVRTALAERGVSPPRLAAKHDVLRQRLIEKSITSEDADRLMVILLQTPRLNAGEQRNADTKTDPLQRSLDILQQSGP